MYGTHIDNEGASEMTNLKDTSYAEMIGDICDEEPMSGWSRATDMPTLSADHVILILQNSPTDVADELTLDVSVISKNYREDGDLYCMASHLRQAVEFSCREAIWPDVMEESSARNERRWERQNESFYGSATPVTIDEQCARDYGVSKLLK